MGFENRKLCDKCARYGRHNPGTGRSFCDTCYCGSHFDDEMTDDNSKMGLEDLKEAWNAQKPVDVSKIVKNLSYNTIGDVGITITGEVDSIPEFTVEFKNGKYWRVPRKNHRDIYDAMVYSLDALSTQNIPELKIAAPTPIIRPYYISKVIFNDPATIVFWADGTKTIVKAVNEPFDKEKGLAMAICKKIFGNKGNYFNVIKEWTEKED